MNEIKSLFNPNRTAFSSPETLSLIGLAAVTALVISLVPVINRLDYPFRLLLTIVHELGHGLTAILTGGRFENFIISPDGSGLAYTGGGLRFLVIPAGYLGAAVFAAVLIWLGRNHQWSRYALGLIGAAMIILSLWFGLPGQFGVQAILLSGLTMLSGVLIGAVLLRVALKATPATIIFFTHLIAIKAGFNAFSDIFALFGLASLSDAPRTDAQAMAELTFIPAVVWAAIWIIAAAVFIGWAIKATWFTQRR